MPKAVRRRHKADYSYILSAILLVVYRQVVIKWQVVSASRPPDDATSKVLFFLHLLLNPWIATVFAAAFLGALCWMITLSRFELSYAYPFMSLSFVVVLGLSMIFFHETITGPKVLSVLLIMAGCTVVGRG